MRHYERNIGDLAAATRGLDLLTRGAYDALLDAYYLDEKPLPLDSAACYLLAGARSATERKAVDFCLARFFQRRDDGYHQVRCDRELERWYAKSESARDAINHRWERERQAKSMIGLDTHDTDVLRSNAAAHTHVIPPTTHDPRPTTPMSQTPSDGAKKPRRSARVKQEGEGEAKGTAVWNAYSVAYVLRYGTEPVRNAKVNGIMAKLVDRLGAEAPAVASHYLKSSKGLYVSSRHAPDLLLRDAEGLRTDWATGKTSTEAAARAADRTQTTGAVFAALKGERNGTDG